MSTELAVIKEKYTQRLARLLQAIKAHDTDYDTRYGLALEALSVAVAIDLKAGVGFDINEPGWPLVYIELPQGQVSWHLPGHDQPWDGHTTEQKYQRVDAFWQAVMGTEVPS